MHSSRLIADATLSGSQDFDRPTVWQRRETQSTLAATDYSVHTKPITSSRVTAKWIRGERALEMRFAAVPPA